MIAIRDFVPSDAPVVRAMQYPDLSEDDVLRLIAEWSLKQYEGCPFQMFAVTQDDTLIGYVSLWQKEAETMSYGVEIYAPYRQKGCAYAASMLAFEDARSKGCRRIISQVRTDNAASLALHRKLGFTITGEETTRHGHLVYLLEKTW